MSKPRELPFVKMQATGNDFVLIDNRTGVVRPDEISALAKKVSDRKFGIGSDGLMLLEEKNGMPIMIYKNPDGSDAGMCGNGARCFVRFARQLGYEEDVRFLVHEKTYRGQINGDRIDIDFPLSTRVERIRVGAYSLLRIYTNTEHVVLRATPETLENEKELVRIGRELRHHPDLDPPGTNVNFISGDEPNHVHLQTYERGVEGLTLACGTGAIASAIAWHHLSGSPGGDHSVEVHVKGGTLTVQLTSDETSGTYNKISLSGAADIVFRGIYTGFNTQ